jgi:hypothetical protein
MGPNPLDAPPAITAVASVGAVGPPAVSAQPSGPPPLPPPPPPPVYSTIYQLADALASGRWAGQPSVSWHVRRPPASSSTGSLVAARRALNSPGQPDGSCMLSKCYLVRERPARCSLRLRRAHCRWYRRTHRRSWAHRPLRLRTRASRPTPGLRALRTACSSPRPIAPRSAQNSWQEGRTAAVGLLRCCRHCASSLSSLHRLAC